MVRAPEAATVMVFALVALVALCSPWAFVGVAHDPVEEAAEAPAVWTRS